MRSDGGEVGEGWRAGVRSDGGQVGGVDGGGGEVMEGRCEKVM